MPNPRLIVAAAACATLPASAGVVLTAVESGGNVVIAGGGTLDLTAWTYDTTLGGAVAGLGLGGVVVGATGSIDLYDTPANPSGPAFITAFTSAATSATGDLFGIEGTTAALGVPAGYVSGNPLNGTATFVGQTFASMSLNPGDTFHWTWGAPGTVTDFFTLNIAPTPGALAPIALASLMVTRRRR